MKQVKGQREDYDKHCLKILSKTWKKISHMTDCGESKC